MTNQLEFTEHSQNVAGKLTWLALLLFQLCLVVVFLLFVSLADAFSHACFISLLRSLSLSPLGSLPRVSSAVFFNCLLCFVSFAAALSIVGVSALLLAPLVCFLRCFLARNSLLLSFCCLLGFAFLCALVVLLLHAMFSVLLSFIAFCSFLLWVCFLLCALSIAFLQLVSL